MTERGGFPFQRLGPDFPETAVIYAELGLVVSAGLPIPVVGGAVQDFGNE